MAACAPALLSGRSGQQFSFTVLPLAATRAQVGGVYAVMRDVWPEWHILYIGQTQNLAERLDQHEHGPLFADYGATHVAVLPVGIEAHRRTIETDLVQRYSPPINQTAHG